MGRKALLATILTVLFLLASAVGLYAYDSSRADQIAEGVTVGGIDIGGLSEGEATELLRYELQRPLHKPIKVRYDGQTWTLAAKKLKTRADIEAIIERALAISREGSLPGRVFRDLTGDEVDEAISPHIEYSTPAINRFVRNVAKAIDREAIDASITPTTISLETVRGQTGRELRDNWLTDRLRAVAGGLARNRTIRAKVRKVKPEVTSKDLAEQYPTYLTVDRATFELRLWKDLKLVETYPVAVGAPGYETPTGLYTIDSKIVDPDWSVPNSDWAGELAGTVVAGGTSANPLKSRWMGIAEGAGIHGTDQDYSLGTAASHGCVRMGVDDVIELYDRVPTGTPIYIQ